jgi:hypothetical protein
MKKRRRIEVFTGRCPICEEAVALVRRLACPDCEVTVSPTSEPVVAARARELGVRSVPAVAADGRLADCCAGRGPEETTLHEAGLGQA